MHTMILNNGVEIPMLGFGTWGIDDNRAFLFCTTRLIKTNTAIFYQ